MVTTSEGFGKGSGLTRSTDAEDGRLRELEEQLAAAQGEVAQLVEQLRKVGDHNTDLRDAAKERDKLRRDMSVLIRRFRDFEPFYVLSETCPIGIGVAVRRLSGGMFEAIAIGEISGQPRTQPTLGSGTSVREAAITALSAWFAEMAL